MDLAGVILGLRSDADLASMYRCKLVTRHAGGTENERKVSDPLSSSSR